jgi:hypothetical protein
MSKKPIIVLIRHHHKLLDLTDILMMSSSTPLQVISQSRCLYGIQITHSVCEILTSVQQVHPWAHWELSLQHQQICPLAPRPALLCSLLKVCSAVFVEEVEWVSLVEQVLVAEQVYQHSAGSHVILREYLQGLKCSVVVTAHPSAHAESPTATCKSL